jgi:hypothetical protein
LAHTHKRCTGLRFQRDERDESLAGGRQVDPPVTVVNGEFAEQAH